jgi:hypothetical protein
VLRWRIGLGLAGALLLLPLAARAADAFAWTPADHPAVIRGREVGNRFDLLSAWEVVLPLDNAFSAENRRALAALEQRLGAVAGIRKVVGPATLLDVAVDVAGKVSSPPVLARGVDGGGVSPETDSEAVRQRVVRRADALGWFLSADGRVARVLIYTDDIDGVRHGIDTAVTGAGLKLSYPGAAVAEAPLMPDPRDAVARWLAAACAAAWILLLALASRGAWRQAGVLSRGRAAVVVLAAACAAGTVFGLVAIGGVRADGLRAAGAATVATAAVLLLSGVARGTEGSTAPRPPRSVALLSLVVVAAAGLTVGRLRLGTQQWRASPLLFVSVRGDFDQPVVLRELRRLTDFLRAEPGVANAWSVADFFFGVQRAGDEVSRIPDSPDEVRRLLVHARQDAAVRLALGADHDEALVAIRLDRETEVDRLDLLDRLTTYLGTELRAALVQVDLNRGTLSPVTRSLAKGILAADARERILRICARSGRNLGEPEMMSVERVARQAAVFATADPTRLRSEFVPEVHALVLSQGHLVRKAEQEKLAAALAVQSPDASVEEVRALLATVYGSALEPAALEAAAARLAARLMWVRTHHAAAMNFKEMLFGADLPTEGMLADEVRSATREAMGPIAGVPVARDIPGALRLDAMAIGGAANDRALSDQWMPGLRAGLIVGAIALAILLLLAGGGTGLLWWPVALAPAALAVLVPALTRDPVGVMFLSVWAGSFVGGAVFATSFAARRAA